MRLLLTGICGFAGSVLARELLAHCSDLQIIGLDSLIRRGSETNVEPLRSLGIDVRIGDIRDRATIEALPAVDWIIDCAANPSVLAGIDGKTSSQDLLDHNLASTIHLLEHCRRHDAGFILLSTSRVYSIEPLATLPVQVIDRAYTPILPQPFAQVCQGLSTLSSGSRFPPQPSNLPLSPSGLRENFPTDPPISLYGASKKCSELLALEYHATFGFPVWINRCGVLAGAGQFGKADQGIFSYWIHSWAQRKPLKYIGFDGQGHQVRDCLHPRDLVPLLLKQIKKSPFSLASVKTLPPSEHTPRVFNLSGGVASALSLRQLSDWCSERFGPHHVASAPTPRPFDIPWIVIDPQTAGDFWNWTPTTPREHILEEIAKHAEKNPGWIDIVA